MLPAGKVEEKLSEAKKEKIWREAIASKRSGAIAHLVAEGGMPDSFDFKTAKLTIEFNGETSEQTVVEILINHERPYTYKCAEKLLARGVMLPELAVERTKFETKADFFKYLANHESKLFIALQKNPKIVTEQDENGKTLLHHALRSSLNNGAMYLLVGAANADFSIIDARGNTVVHSVIMYSERDRNISYHGLPAILKAAMKSGYDFSLRNKEGFAPLHLAVAHAYYCHVGGYRYRNVGGVLGMLKASEGKFDIDVVATCKEREYASTPLYLAVRSKREGDIRDLLDAGANPLLHPEGEPSVKELLAKFVFRVFDEKEGIPAVAYRSETRAVFSEEELREMRREACDERIERVMKQLEQVISYERKTLVKKPVVSVGLFSKGEGKKEVTMDSRVVADRYVRSIAPKGLFAIIEVRRLLEAKKIDKARVKFSSAIDVATEMMEYNRILHMFVSEKTIFSSLSVKVRDRGMIVLRNEINTLLTKVEEDPTKESLSRVAEHVDRIMKVLHLMKEVNLQELIKTSPFDKLIESLQTLRDKVYLGKVSAIFQALKAGKLEVPSLRIETGRQIVRTLLSILDGGYEKEVLCQFKSIASSPDLFKAEKAEESDDFNNVLSALKQILSTEFRPREDTSDKRTEWVQELKDKLTFACRLRRCLLDDEAILRDSKEDDLEEDVASLGLGH